jgi:uncharacterized protein HemY
MRLTTQLKSPAKRAGTLRRLRLLHAPYRNVSCLQENSRGQVNIGCLLADVFSEIQDYEEATRWLTEALEQGIDFIQVE